MMIRPLVTIGLLALAACARDSGDARTSAPPPPPPQATVPAAADSPQAASASADSAAAPRDTAGVWILNEHGVGPVRVGMRVAQADTATPGGLDRTTDLAPECDVLHPKRGPRGLSFLFEDARLARVAARDGARVATRLGIRLGDGEARVRQLYPAARVRPHKYVAGGHELVVIPGAPADTLYRIVFETDGKVVTEMRGGLWPPVEYVEGCS
jgi:hypothetical protein